ncbi:PREDICTED: uncharacterized protein LOC108618052 [Drosophila arizonae]|uniref:Uncharacterized protein LOC108618052 n=1 Tax=Drosophila arizonae TaxID=7263 RepID=A0ABM1PQG1_DROAR|nr:PREDICTED: uncharacterized protein LOC108618052 [Drosophila arizonae]
MGRWMNDLKSGRLWSMKMIDSWGSLPSGILYFNFLDMGNYGECIKVNKEVSSGPSIKGKYCFAEIPILKMLGIPVNRNLKIGICFPSSCSAAQMGVFLGKVIQQVIGLTSPISLVNEKSCRTNEREPLNGIAILTIVLLSIFAALALLATLYDYFLVSDQVGQRPFSQIIVHAEFAVDTFFLLSGMLVVMVTLRAMERSKGKLNIPLMYLHRYLRLTPLLAMTILVYMKLLPLMVDGPLDNDGYDDAVKRIGSGRCSTYKTMPPRKFACEAAGI